ncbi:hypothetical protein PCCS19_36080 [Paenibacillus sp. CCS19]|uniref:DNA/RNA helicase domain-containing protein n=1 Tax=Paenibacillus sp. CCS19 TaxID=3158387 RepID=UPI00256E7589|nr:DNA/RNA helicase domain-containing protein [Paenibacillus cellulosilyticus]GMK40552.1 hypothetical protein PCCS19_36080 [Paenibacillus cellulosilyticus]
MGALNENCGWKGTIQELLNLDKEELVSCLTDFLSSFQLTVNTSHENSWRDTYIFLHDAFHLHLNKYKDLYVVFEYILPLEKGRRPDVLLMLKERVIVLEFKSKDKVLIEDVEQTIGYREDLLKFHHVTYKKNVKVEGHLVLTQAVFKPEQLLGISILVKSRFIEDLHLNGESFQNNEDVTEWIQSSYQPLPSITKATLDLFKYGALPCIKNIEEGAISKTVSFIKKRIHSNETIEKRKQIIFVSGVPGAGKTLVALKTLYDYNAYQFKHNKNPVASIYLSGNGPLVNVLQTQLEDVEFNAADGRSYIRGVYAYKREYLDSNKVPPFHCIFFDEAQRAWDAAKMKGPLSEPEGLLQVGEKIYAKHGHVTIICFIGDGQAIHTGEEKGMSLWKQALTQYPTWQLLVPPKYSETFNGLRVHESDDLFLDTSIRSNFIDTSKLLESLLDLDLDSAKNELLKMKKKGYILRVSRNFEASKYFIEQKLVDYPDMMYGMLVSSKVEDNLVQSVTKTPTYKSYMKDTDAGRWFLHDSKTWKQGATEFVCQGLELDFPLVCFGGDYYVNNGRWVIEDRVSRKYNNKYEDFPTIVKNIYRVLLSRARKGMVLFIPVDLRETYEVFLKIGAEEV